MKENTHVKNFDLKNFTYLFIILFVIWLFLTTSFHWQEISVGIFISLILALYLHKNYLELGLPKITIKKIIYFIMYIIVLLIEIIKANFDVAYRVLHPSLPIKPGIVVIKTKLKQDIAKTILANSITLTPGTFTLDIEEDELLIHWIYVRTEDETEATKIIGEKFEKYLRVVFA
ncbi:MAG: Na+/H+ antiporter subunit E [Candidatus Tenebribacter davisii]|jgi:multicomponent Na+:H+ antiporter subunit E|nr:Na+/H+ antiporter subunit E [Candidatus Tenebribacter davisii]